MLEERGRGRAARLWGGEAGWYLGMRIPRYLIGLVKRVGAWGAGFLVQPWMGAHGQLLRRPAGAWGAGFLVQAGVVAALSSGLSRSRRLGCRLF